MKKFWTHICFMFFFGCFFVDGQTVIRGPYLQKGTSNSIVIKWRTSIATQSVVNYGTNFSSLGNSSHDNTLKTDHEIEINSLSSNTKYYYEIGNNSSTLVPKSNDLFFRTHPEIGSREPYSFWILGDCGTANNNQRSVRDAYYSYAGSNETSGILFLGDNAYNSGTDSEYQDAIFENMYEGMLKNTVSWSCLGNHDGYTANSNSQTGPYYDIFTFPTSGESGGTPSGTEAYYSFDYGNVHFISLDSYETDRSVGGAMYNWCLSDIQNTTQEWIVAFWHHPPYSKGSHDSDSETELIEMRQNFVPMLEANGVDVVFSGHSHSYERSYFINGHYGHSNTFNAVTHTVGANGIGDGKVDGDGRYYKETSGIDAGDGTIYITAGSSGKISWGPLDHEAMIYSIVEYGSCILEVDKNVMNVKFIRETGAIEDYFTIEKECDTDCITLNELHYTIDELKAYPNPVNKILNISFSNDQAEQYGIRILNILGQEVYDTSIPLNGSSLKIDITPFSKGLYFIEIINTSSNTTSTKTFIKR